MGQINVSGISQEVVAKDKRLAKITECGQEEKVNKD